MAQSYLRSPTIQRLPELLDWLRDGDLQIPSFQRAVVWTGDQRLSLCDTIMRGLPMGSIMVWRTTRKFATKGFSGPFKPLASETTQGTHQYLLDGQQRLTSIFAALGPALWTRDEENVPWQNQEAPDGTSWRIGFDVTEDVGEFVLLEEQEIDRKILPLDVLLDDTAYDDWRADDSLDRAQKNRARKVRSAFVDYLIPVVPLATDDLEPVTLTFKRVNSGGTSMGDFDMVRALSWTDDFDLETVLEEKIKPGLELLGWESLDRGVLLKIIATGYKMSPGEIEWEKLSRAIHQEPDKFIEISKALNWAIGFLSEIGFAGPKTLPYANILVFAVRAWQQADGELGVDAKQVLKTWIVDAAVTTRFSAAPPHIVNAAWRELQDKIAGNAIRNQRATQRQPKASHGVHFRWARSIVTTAVLAQQEPRSSNGVVIPNVARNVGMYGKDWYRKLLFEPGSKDKLFLSAANRVVCDPVDFESLQQALFDPNCDKALLVSHAISSDAHQHLLDDNKLEFLMNRSKKIVQLENAWLSEHGSSLTVQEPDQGSGG